MLFEVYYKNYAKNCKGKYWEEEKSLPYIVLERDVKKRNSFYGYLASKGFKCVSWNYSYPAILVNPKLMRFGMINKAAKYPSIDEKNYTIDEFKEEILSKINFGK